MAEGLFDRIRARCSEVTRRARFVRIDDSNLEGFAERLAVGPGSEDSLDPVQHFQGGEEDLLAFVVTLDAINFGSGWFPRLRKRGGLSGYRTIAMACKERFEMGPPLDGPALRDSTPDSMATLLGQDLTDPEITVLMQLFAQAWRDLGVWIQEHFDDRFQGIVAHAAGSAERLVTALAEMPLYRDVARYGEIEVPLYKRAQITVADLHRTFGDGPLGHFDDLHQLTLFADNLVPHVLRCEGVLRYEASLAERIDSEERIESGSLEEIEIRAVAVEAVERLVLELTRRGKRTTAYELDERLWNAGQSPKIKARPRHRTLSTFY